MRGPSRTRHHGLRPGKGRPLPAVRSTEAGVDGRPAHVRTPRTIAQVTAFLALLRTADDMRREVEALLKTADLSSAQYNVLRILRGAPPEGLTCGDVIGGLIQHDPDVTRLMDKLERRGLLERGRDGKDRRVVRTRITEEGLRLLAGLDEPVDRLHEQQLGHMTAARLGELGALLEQARAGIGKS